MSCQERREGGRLARVCREITVGTAGPSGFHSANTHREPRGKAGQIHRLGARGFTDRERKSRRGKGSGRHGKKKKERKERNRRKKKKQRKDKNKEKGPKGVDAIRSFVHP